MAFADQILLDTRMKFPVKCHFGGWGLEDYLVWVFCDNVRPRPRARVCVYSPSRTLVLDAYFEARGYVRREAQ